MTVEHIRFALLAFIPALLNLGLIFFTIYRLPKSRTTDIFIFFVLALFLWQVEDTIARLTVSSEIIAFWDRVCSIGWIGMAPLAFHFACKLSSLKKLTSRFALFTLYGPFVIFYVLYVSNPDISNFIKDDNWGWLATARPGTFDGLQRYWISLVVMATVFILLRYAYGNRYNKEKKFQARIIAIGILLPAIQGIVTQVIFPLVLNIKEIPLTSTFMSIFSIATIIAITRYKLFHVSESIQADSLLEHLKKIILIISPEKKIIYINQQASEVLGISPEVLYTADFQNIFFDPEKNFVKYSHDVFDQVIKGYSVNNHSSEFLTHEKKKINVLVTSTPVINNNIVQGIMLVVNDITEMVNAIETLEEERKLKEKAITHAVIIAQEKERKNLGSELHDNINQILASSLLYLNLEKKENKKDGTHLSEIEELIHLAIAEIRKLSHSLIAPKLNETELTEALEKIIAIAGKTSVIKIQKEIRNIDENSIPEELKLNIYRIVQEQFHNIIKYAKAENIQIKLIQEGKKLLLSIKDDGVGFDMSRRSDGVGLTNMKTRAALYNANLNIISSPGKGCELYVIFENVGLSSMLGQKKELVLN